MFVNISIYIIIENTGQSCFLEPCLDPKDKYYQHGGSININIYVDP